MIQIIKVNFNKRSTLYHMGVRYAIAVSDSLMCKRKKVEKKIVNYLVVPNNFILSLSLSLSLIGATGVTSPQNILAYAREAPLRNSFR